MLLLAYLSYKKNKYLFIGVNLFIVFCFFVNKTQDSNYFIYPVLKDGTATVLLDGYQHTFLKDGSGDFQSSPTMVKCSGCGEEKITPVKSGAVYKVIGIHHENADFADKVGVITEIGAFSSLTTNRVDKNRAIDLNKPIQSEWSIALGSLMYWPVPLFLIFNFSSINFDEIKARAPLAEKPF